jgi:hypothetical protein
MDVNERIWYEDWRSLLDDSKLLMFVPRRHMTATQRLNALMRFALIYALVYLALCRSFAVFVFVPIATAAITFLLHEHARREKMQDRDKMKELDVERDPVSKRMCTVPTTSNPFMNVLLTDYTRFPTRPPACDLMRKSVKKRAEKSFRHNLYSDSDDVFGRRTNSRQFYAMPSTQIPNDQDGFASWLYRTGPTCKEGRLSACAAKMHRRMPGR